MMSTLRLFAASCTAKLLDVVVLPTPPFPPTNIHLRDWWSNRWLSVGFGSASSVICR